MEDLVDSQDVVDSVGWDAPFAGVPGQVVSEAGFVDVFLLAEGACLGFPGHLLVPCVLVLRRFGFGVVCRLFDV